MLALWPALGAAAEPGLEGGADPVSVELRLEGSRVYVHQRVPVTVTLRAGPATVRNLQYPRLKSAAGSLAEFAAPRERRVTHDGREYVAYEFATVFIPRQAGAAVVGPAEVRFDLLAAATGPAAFFGGTETRPVTVLSAPVIATVLSPPERGRPPGYTGTVGRLAMTRDVVPTEIRSGDAVTVTTRIEGVGNLDTLACPSVTLPGVRSYPPRIQATARRLTCEQVLVPETAADLEIPAASVAAFDPQAAQYRTLRAAPVRVTVVAAARNEVAVAAPDATALPEPKPGSPRTEAPTAIPWLVAGGMLLLTVVVLVARRRTAEERGNRAPAPAPVTIVTDWLAEAERAQAAAAPADFHTAAYRALQGHLGRRYGIPAGGLTGDVVDREVRPVAADPSLPDACAQLFAVLDRARYGGAETGPADREDTLRLLRRVVGPG